MYENTNAYVRQVLSQMNKVWYGRVVTGLFSQVVYTSIGSSGYYQSGRSP